MFGVIVFVGGFVLMVLELAGSRILAPYVGTSLPVWTSLIGIILASLSFGYWLGGRIADSRPSIGPLISILLLAGASIAVINPLQALILPVLSSISPDLKLNAVLSALILFGVPSVLLGMISPYAIRLNLDNIKKTGQTAGNLYAISTIGSILGTFIGGFFLIAHLPTGQILILLSLTMLLMGIVLMIIYKTGGNFKLFPIAIFLLGFAFFSSGALKPTNLLEFDTLYNRVWIVDRTHPETGKEVRHMLINTENSSAMFLKSEELVFDYTKFYDLAHHFNPRLNETLMIGGAAFSYPKHFLRKYPEAKIDVVEIDPGVTELAKKYFRLKDDPRLTIYHEDGRTFLNRVNKQYDVIFNDAYSSAYSVPFQLTTKEAVERMHINLSQDGIVISNVIGAIEGEKSQFFKAELATYQSVFPHVLVFPVRDVTLQTRQNVIVIASKQKPKSLVSRDKDLNEMLERRVDTSANGIRILTDDFAPVDQYNLDQI